ncbi:neuroligin-1-like isoform X2 [Pomacea canaliculata]|uniref:neuroligin-1-like isoform X2 n=1 Tax=Pomacea canaliculata TaxID=400727 RepID=UPI000D738263|nr:neuroligin-1-like isoform X2 [Pomacea canaliculata]
MLRVLTVLPAFLLAVLAEDVVVTTTLGQLRGSRVSTGPSTYLDTFFGVPYAKPPVGALRLMPTQPAEPWQGVLDATRYGPACPQLADFDPMPTSEDCLSLSIFTPGETELRTRSFRGPPRRSKHSAPGRGLPVMMYVHGGGFRTGSGALFNGTELAKRGVVVVAINYRLDILGFLSTLDDSSPGNYGLLDMIQALKWIKANIASFRGNPGEITLFGGSAGSLSISHLRISPLAKGLFNKVIMESGFATCKWARKLPTDTPSPLTSAKRVATRVGCPVDSGTAALVACIKSKPVDILLNASAAFLEGPASSFIPVVETGFGVLPKNPEDLIREGAGSDIPSIRGSSRDEDAIDAAFQPLISYSLSDAEAEIRTFASTYFKQGLDNVTAILLSEYVTRLNPSTKEELYLDVVQMKTDLRFNYPMLYESQVNSNRMGSAPQYVYQFAYQSPNSRFPSWIGVPHGAEAPFVAGEPFNGLRNWTDTDKRVSATVMDMLSNFAKFGDPTPPLFTSVKWFLYNSVTQLYLTIDSKPTLNSHLYQRRMDLVKSLYDQYGHY